MPQASKQATKSLESWVRLQARVIRRQISRATVHDGFWSALSADRRALCRSAPKAGAPGFNTTRAASCDRRSNDACSVAEQPTMGFRTLAIQKRSSEVWRVLGAVKTEFGKFGDMLDKVKKKLDETGNTIDDAVHRSRQIERRLRKVEALPAQDGVPPLAEPQILDVENEEVGEIPE